MDSTLVYIIERKTLDTSQFLTERETEEVCKQQMTLRNAVVFLLYRAHWEDK